MNLINRDDISFYCSYNGDCMADEEKCRTCEHYVCTYKEIYEKDKIDSDNNIRDRLEKLINYIKDAERYHLDMAKKGIVENGIKSQAIQDIVIFIEHEIE